MSPKKRRLEDLYVVGRDLVVDDGQGQVAVWLQKLNPLEHEKAIRKAGAAKARGLMVRNDPDSEGWQEAYADVEDLGPREEIIEYLIVEDVAKTQESAEAELAFTDEWSKEDYLQGLRDAWEDPERPLKDTYAQDPEDPEARRVFLELKRFADTVTSRVEPEMGRLRRDYQDVPDETLRRKATERFIELRAGLAWLREYRYCEIWLATRDPDNHDAYYFPDREAVDRLSPQVYRTLVGAYQELTVEPMEGKGSEPTRSSSPPSEPPNGEATSESSGLTAVTP
jgi:hypothetical protein